MAIEVVPEGCAVCSRSVYEGEKFCDDCMDFFINYFDTTEITVCQSGNECLKVANAEGINCQQCRVAKCIRTGMKLPDFMLHQENTENVQPVTISPDFIQNLMDSLLALQQPIANGTTTNNQPPNQ